LLQLDYEESRGKLYFKFVIDFVGRPLLLQRLVGQGEHVIFFIKGSQKMPWGVFSLIRRNFKVPFVFEVAFSVNVCSLMKWCTAVDERLEAVHTFPPLLNL
jgi:hypothetical protein